MPASVPAIDSGTVTAAAMVGTRRRRNTSTTSSTIATVISSVNWMSLTLARIVPVRSEMTVRSISGGIQERRSGSTARTRSVVSMTFEPADLMSVSRIAGFCPFHAARRELATPLTTFATSPMRRMRPFVDFRISAAYSLACDICPLMPISSARCGPSKPPVGCVTLAERTAL